MKRDTRQTILDTSEALHERDNRIAQLEKQLKDAKDPRSRVLLIGGPRDGDMQLVATSPYAPPVIEVLLPPAPPSMYLAYSSIENVRFLVAVYRITEVQTYDGRRLVGLYEGTR